MNKQKTFSETPSHTDTNIITASDAALRFIASMHGAEVPLEPFSAAVTAQALASALHPYKTPHGRETDSMMVMAISTTQQQSATADPLHTAHPSPEQLYTMVTAHFKAGTFPWSMVSESGKSAWAAAAAELVFAPDTIMASHAPQPGQQQAERECCCGWRGPAGDCLWLGEVGPLCPECRETTEQVQQIQPAASGLSHGADHD